MARTSSITMPSMVEIAGHTPAIDKKVFFICHAFGTMKNVMITETLLSSVIFKTIMVPLHRGRYVVVHLYSSISMDLRIFP